VDVILGLAISKELVGAIFGVVDTVAVVAVSGYLYGRKVSAGHRWKELVCPSHGCVL
jgi:hypothetical protein